MCGLPPDHDGEHHCVDVKCTFTWTDLDAKKWWNEFDRQRGPWPQAWRVLE